ncbi:hypothetical protein J2S54_006839 [Streptomyces sp. DSM 42143]|nr:MULTISPECIES: RICIN domain-containing protein [unclassified Streptomyces]MDN3248573.1 RICIN domain-containing protein [Streptomyces sp. ZSW22]MDN3256108.1 RICIN domain-containing protein [Streptomyces sp. MA25(2023)]MDQ0390019.1 hypothetical protein [Streptomyces sp. DSM 42143]PAK25260.1 hypothetical protein CJD44_17640 [Streptomyces sp. alain-838]
MTEVDAAEEEPTTTASENPAPPALQAPQASSVNIPTDRDVWIDHMVTSLHLNSAGFHGAPNGHALLFHDRNNIDTLGEKWRFTQHWDDGTYTIANAESGHELAVASSGLHYKKVVLSGRLYPTGQRWRLRPSGLFGSFSIHPVDDPTLAIAPLTDSNRYLYLLPYQPYLTHFFRVAERDF